MWFLHSLSSEYDSFRMMLTNNRKADQAKVAQTEPEFDSILEQVLSLDTKKKVSKPRSMKKRIQGHRSKENTKIFNAILSLLQEIWLHRR